MQVQFELTIGENKFTLTEEVENHIDFFKKLHFYSTLPKVGPNGETDLVLAYRVAQKKYDYFSIVSQKAQMEFKFGQSIDSKGTLFAKGWEPLFKAENETTDEFETQNTSSGNNVGLGATRAVPAQKAPLSGLGAQTLPTPTAAAVTPVPSQVQAQAKNVLSKFGI